jgi:hypothetical protein
MKKNAIKEVLLKSLRISFLPLLLMVLGVGCDEETPFDDEPDQIIGTWQQTKRTIDGSETTIDSTRLLMQINDDHICVLSDLTAAAIRANKSVSRSGWSYRGGLLNIAIDLPASYTVTTGTNVLSLERTDFNKSGALSKTVLEYKRIDTIEF